MAIKHEIRTTYEDFKNFEKAWLDFVKVIGKKLKLFKLLDKINEYNTKRS